MSEGSVKYLKGTSHPYFGIGKNGVNIFQDKYAPQNTLGFDGDLFVYRGLKPKLYQKVNGKWISSQSKNIVTVNHDYTTTIEDQIILVDTTLNPVTITISHNNLIEGLELVIKDIGGNSKNNNITIVTDGYQKIDGDSFAKIDFSMISLTFITDGLNWYII